MAKAKVAFLHSGSSLIFFIKHCINCNAVDKNFPFQSKNGKVSISFAKQISAIWRISLKLLLNWINKNCAWYKSCVSIFCPLLCRRDASVKNSS